jgi:hypothetical protein
MKKTLLILSLILISLGLCQAQFLDSFDGKKIEGWFFFTGDGFATMNFTQEDGFARLSVDGTPDQANVWWAIIKRDVSSYLDLKKLHDPAYALRVEAKVRVSQAPRRVNFMANTQRTTNYHAYLMEYDIPDTNNWHVISMTFTNFDAVPGDKVYVQLGLTDCGLEHYHVDVDYYRADVVNVAQAGPDKGEPIPYHPPIPNTDTFSHHFAVTQDSLINSDFPDINFNDWHVEEQNGTARILTVTSVQWPVLRWDFLKYKNAKADGAGLLEVTTCANPMGGKFIEHYGQDFGEEFGKIRVIEILGGDPDWNQETVTYNSLLQGHAVRDVINSQMIYDVDISGKPGSKNYITISRPVMQRLLDGKTKGLVIRPLGAVATSIYASENKNNGPVLHFNTAQDK